MGLKWSVRENGRGEEDIEKEEGGWVARRMSERATSKHIINYLYKTPLMHAIHFIDMYIDLINFSHIGQ